MRNAFLASLFLGGCAASGQTGDAAPPPLSVPRLLDAPSLALASLDALYNEAILRDGSVDPTVRRLAEYARNESHALRFRAHAWHAASHLHWRIGRLEEAGTAIDNGLALEATPELLVHRGRLHEAAGDLERAVDFYSRALDGLKDFELREQLQLRLVFLGSNAGNVGALVEFARARDAQFRNRAAVALAILGHPREALALYEVSGDETQQRRAHLRRAQWALQAGLAGEAQDAAWAALKGTPLARDRRYGLALLVEAHELDSSWDRLLEGLAARPELGEDGVAVRVQILERTRRLDDAIALLGELDHSLITPEAQRTLLRMYGEAGRGDAMIAEFRRLMEQQPEALAWPRGLSEHLLETGQREAAAAVWQQHLSAIRNAGQLLAAAEALAQLEFDDLAMEVAERCVREHPEHATAVANFRFELALQRGRVEDAKAILEALERDLPEFSPGLVQLASHYERMQLPARAVAVWERLARRPAGLGPEEQMRLAWLYDTVGRRDESYALWRSLWNDNATPSRLRLVEDRLLTMGAELGSLANLAIEIEERVFRGEASPRETALLVRLYTKVDDATSAVEIIREQFKRQGDSPEARIASLEEQAKVYRALMRPAAYERVTLELLELNPPKAVEYLQGLVLKEINAGRAADVEKLQRWLGELKRRNPGADEGFEAGVLQMIGQTDRAIAAYQRALALRPGESESYLLLAELLAGANRTGEALAMLQYFAEHGADDNGFVIAVDGLLNRRLPPDSPALAWAQRRVLERITRKESQFFLYDLSAEVGEEMGDRTAYLSSLEASLVDAGPRRGTVLRELIAATDATPKNLASKRADPVRNLQYSRRLIALGEEMPSEVYLNLGRALLRLGNPKEALSVFRSAIESTGDNRLLAKAADEFEAGGYDAQAATLYEKSLTASTDDALLRVKLSRVQYRQIDDERAAQTALDALRRITGEQLIEIDLASTVRVAEPPVDGYGPEPADPSLSFDYTRYADMLSNDLLRAVGPEQSGEVVDRLEQDFAAALEATTPALDASNKVTLRAFPRLRASAEIARRVSLSTGHYATAARIDEQLFALFPQDAEMIARVLDAHLQQGRHAAARRLAAVSGIADSHARDVERAAVSVVDERDARVLVQHAIRSNRFQLAVSIACALGEPELALQTYQQWINHAFEATSPEPRQLFRGASVVAPLRDAQLRLAEAHFNQLARQVSRRPDFDRIVKGLLVARGSPLLGRIEAAVGRPLLSREQLQAHLETLSAADVSVLDFDYVKKHVSPETWNRIVVAGTAGLDLAGNAPSKSPQFGTTFSTALMDAAFQDAVGDELARAIEDALAGYYARMKEVRGMNIGYIAMLQLNALRETRPVHRGNVELLRRLEAIVAATLAGDGAMMRANGLPLLEREAAPSEVLARLLAVVDEKADNERAATNPVRQLLRSFAFRDQIFPHRRAPLLEAVREQLLWEGPDIRVLAVIAALKDFDPDPLPRYYEAVARQAAAEPSDDPVGLEITADLCGEVGLLSDERSMLERLVKLVPDHASARRRLHDLWIHFDEPEKALAYRDPSEAQRVTLSRVDSYGASHLEPVRQAAEQLVRAEDGRAKEKALRRLAQLVRDEIPGSGYRPAPLFRTYPLNQEIGGDSVLGLIEQCSKVEGFRGVLLGLLSTKAPSRVDDEDFCELYVLLADSLARENLLETEFGRLNERVKRGDAGYREITLWLELASRLPAGRVQEVIADARTMLVGSFPRYNRIQLARLLAVSGNARHAADGYALVAADTLAYGDHRENFRANTESRILSMKGVVQDAARVLGTEGLARLLQTCGTLLVSHGEVSDAEVVNEALLELTELALANGIADPVLPEIDPALFHGSPELLARLARVNVRTGRASEAMALLQPILNQNPMRSSELAQRSGYSRLRQAVGLDSTAIFERAEVRRLPPDAWPLTREVRLLFSEDMPSTPHAAGWLARAGESIRGWMESGVVSRRHGLPALALVALRQQPHDAAAARATAEQLIRLAGGESEMDGETATLIAQASAATGADLPADLSERLLRNPDIRPSALAGLIDRIAKLRGASAALSAAEPILAFTRNARLLQTLENLSRESGDVSKARDFASLREAADRLRADQAERNS